MHVSNYGVNTVCAAGALSIVKRLDNELFEQVCSKGEYLKEELLKLPKVEAVSGMGLMIGVKTTLPASQVAAECLEKGLMVLTAKENVRLLPALNIPFELLERAVAILGEVLS